ncbi:MAG: FmdB family zinc ribbon protein [Candidatus Acidiferrales bacterium]
MPIYEYLCEECQTEYEKLVLSKAEKVSCPKCGSGRKTLQLSTFAAHSGNGTAKAASREAAPACMGNPSACACSFKN